MTYLFSTMEEVPHNNREWNAWGHIHHCLCFTCWGSEKLIWKKSFVVIYIPFTPWGPWPISDSSCLRPELLVSAWIRLMVASARGGKRVLVYYHPPRSYSFSSGCILQSCRWGMAHSSKVGYLFPSSPIKSEDGISFCCCCCPCALWYHLVVLLTHSTIF